MPAAVKRKEPTEGTRRSDRGAATGDAADVETKGAAKAGKDDAAPAKKAKVAPKYAEDSDDDEEDEDEEEVEEKKGAKKGGVGSVVSDVVLKDGECDCWTSYPYTADTGCLSLCRERRGYLPRCVVR
jgi:hypothetical protein